jgi:hypothetical protein
MVPWGNIAVADSEEAFSYFAKTHKSPGVVERLFIKKIAFPFDYPKPASRFAQFNNIFISKLNHHHLFNPD